MKYLVTGKEMQLLDKTTSEYFHVPTAVLMEQAAMVFVRELLSFIPENAHILAVCGLGNNGADGIAIARLLNQRQKNAAVYTLKSNFPDKKGSELFELQQKIYETYDYPVVSDLSEAEHFDVIIDAVFGIGLARPVGGEYAKVIHWMNSRYALKVAVDISSGIDADKGRVFGCAVKCDHTITFSFGKTGHYLWPGSDYSGVLHVQEMGITAESCLDKAPSVCSLEKEDLIRMLPERKPHSNKGSYGKLLIVAGSKGMAGACLFAAKAAYRCGTGLVYVLTEESNRLVIQSQLPEAVLKTYSEQEPAEDIETKIHELCKWADAVVVGPGLGQSITAGILTRCVLKQEHIPVIADADALNYLARDRETLLNHRCPLVVTPHLGEMSRLTGETVARLQEDLIGAAVSIAKEYDLCCVLKDFRTVTAAGDGRITVNLSGNHGMATGGSGDVLAGVIGGFLAQKMQGFEAASLGVYLHGLAGDAAADKGRASLMASDIIEGIPLVFQEISY